MIFGTILFGFLGLMGFFSTYFEWEFLKKEWQKGQPYSTFDKVLGYMMSAVCIGLAVFIYFKTT